MEGNEKARFTMSITSVSADHHRPRKAYRQDSHRGRVPKARLRIAFSYDAWHWEVLAGGAQPNHDSATSSIAPAIRIEKANKTKR